MSRYMLYKAMKDGMYIPSQDMLEKAGVTEIKAPFKVDRQIVK